jgi:hypothetical protein
MKKTILLLFLFLGCLNLVNAQSELNYPDFHLSPSPGNPSQNTIILFTNFITIDTVSYQNYTLSSTSICTYGSYNSLAYYIMNPTTPTGLGASNIYITYQVPARKYYISDVSGIYDNGYDFSYYMSCQLGPVFYIYERTVYSEPERMISYPVHPGLTFIDSSYYSYISNSGGCQDPAQLNTSLSSSGKSLILGKGLNVGKLTTPCATYDTVYFIRRTLFTDEERHIHMSGMDTAFHYFDSSYTEKYKIKTTNIIGIARNHHYILFDENVIENRKYFPDTTLSVDTISRFFYRDPSASIETINNILSISLYPNPTHQSATLQFNNPQNENHTLTLYNTYGQLVREINNITADKVTIGRQNLANGMYFFRLTAEGKLVGTGKLIME